MQEAFPLSTGNLSYHQTVRSPVVEIIAQGRNQTHDYRFPLILQLTSDLVANSTKSVDYCLGKVDSYTKKWKCASR